MTTRKWIVEKGHRCCNNHRCNNYAGEAGVKCTVTLNPVSGAIGTFCPTCKQTSLFQARSWKERRPCQKCKWVRNVTVTNLGSSHDEYARGLCDACELMNSVAVHRATAARLQVKALEIIRLRKEKKAGAGPSLDDSVDMGFRK